jgi:hypothetical protein
MAFLLTDIQMGSRTLVYSHILRTNAKCLSTVQREIFLSAHHNRNHDLY